MKANTALLFVLLGFALQLERKDERTDRIRHALAIVLIAVPVATGCQELFGIDLGIDELLFSDPTSRVHGQWPGRMSPATALNFFCLGVALYQRRSAAPDRWWARALAVIVALTSFVSFAGYLFEVQSLYKVGAFSTIALHTVMGFLAACIGFVMARPEEGLVSVATSQSAAGVLLRRILPAVVLGPLVLGWLHVLRQGTRAYDTPFQIAVLTVGNVVLLATILGAAAKRMQRSEAQLGASEQRFRLMVEAIQGYAIIMLDLNGRVATWNVGAERFSGYSATEVLGQHVSLFYTPENVAAGKLARELAVARHEGRFETEDFCLRKGGERFWASVVLSLLRDGDGVPTGFAGVFRDMTEQRRVTEQLRLAIEAAPLGMFIADTTGKLILVNSQLEELFGYTRAELIGSSVELLVPERFRGQHPASREAFFSDPTARPMSAPRDVVGRRKDGTEVSVEVGLTPVELSGERFVISSVVDTTARKREERARDELAEQKKEAERLRERSRFFELSLDMVCVANTSGHFLQINPAFSQNLGYSTEELLGRPFLEFVHPEDRAETLREVEKLARGVPTLDFTNRYRCRDGSYRWFQWRSAPEADGTLYAVARDITPDRELLDTLQHERKSLSDSLREREVLLQEVHHRVKNNLQVISSLINLQARQLDDSRVRAALHECRTRVEAMALIHEKLYQSKDYARVPFSDYAKSLARGIFEASAPARSNIALELQTDDVTLPVDRAIPCALVLNELLTNSLKHAFSADRRGLLRVGLHEHDGEVTLTVADDGVGIPNEVDPADSPSLGMQLVLMLSRQLDGKLELQRSPGTTVRMTFSIQGRV